MPNHSRGRRSFDDLKIVSLPISSLKPNPCNARTHTRRQIRKIAHSIRVLGFNCPIIIDENYFILAGHAVFEAAKLRGMTDVPTMRLAHMTEAEKRAFVIAHNRLAEEAGWDRSLLAVEFKTLFEIAPELDLTITGFEFGEIEFIIDALDQAKTDALDDVAPPDPRRSSRYAAWRPVAARPSSSAMRRCNTARIVCACAPGRAGADGVHGPAL